ncbi:putative salicylate hydroxylase [Aspergillus heteromorphus CBS 117.55]|uniref:Putative salicylate hydroxylase n=1 Tax=Aspergillus heteromorphus CBS 117.55 TaxID=1448321 RepID=A0A317W0K9_9EURO|nr:putative salicylate hydroxylase [Aspergillus heteromorphus CBS 117.55]PWY79151.1 putative salicylate hydroxylase [Aspergillus heteromorphus CBS 117.55]
MVNDALSPSPPDPVLTRPFNQENDPVPLEIAIIGGGIIGVMLALGLLHHGIQVTVYERASTFPEIGAGMAFTAVARECMRRLSPQVLAAFERVGSPNPHPQNRYWDGFHPTTKEEAQSADALLFQLSTHDMGFWTCLRAGLLNEMSRELPEGTVKFGKRLVSYEDDEVVEKVVLRFADGSEGRADAVIGCDGLRSRTRQLLLGESNPAAYPSYSHKVAYRAVVPIAAGMAALGEDRGSNQCLQMGPGAHMLTYPLAGFTLMNVAIFTTDPTPWPDASKITMPATRSEVASVFASWSPSVREIIALLPENLTKWALYDMYEHPAASYCRGRVCLVGDAAHASSPHHGAGACMGVEDCLAMVTALDSVRGVVQERKALGVRGAVRQAFEAVNAVRWERSQWQVRSARETGDIYEWMYPGSGDSSERCKQEIEGRTRRIWEFSVEEMVREVRVLMGEARI